MTQMGVILAERLGWSQPKVSRIESGQRTPAEEDLLAFAQVVGAPAEVEVVAEDLHGQVGAHAAHEVLDAVAAAERVALLQSALALLHEGAASIVDAEGPLGLISLCSRVAVRQFVQADLEMLVSLAPAGALRVRNVALHREVWQAVG